MSGAGARMQASDGPHRCSAAAISHASKGGLEKYPSASSRDHAQYCDSSKKRSTVEKRNATKRTIVSVATMRTAVQKLQLGDIAEPAGDIITDGMLDRVAARASINRPSIG